METKELNDAIVADLRDQSMTYIMIATKNHTSTSKVQKLSQQHGLTRKRGRKPARNRTCMAPSTNHPVEG